MSRARKPTNEGEEPDRDLASELRQSAGREWSEEAAEDEQLTELLRRRRRTLNEVLAEAAGRGDSLSAEFGAHTFSGTATMIGDDFVSLRAAGQSIDVRFTAASWSVLPAEGRTDVPELTRTTFVALLRGYETDRTELRIALPNGETARCRISVVASDHVETINPEGWIRMIPLGIVLATIRSTDPQ